MNETEIVEISTRVLERLSIMGDELINNLSCEKMIFPQKKNEEKERRISEQELRFVFVDEFLKRCKEGYYYSVETPTEKKYSFGKCFCDIRVDKYDGQSALSDMMIYKREKEKYTRNLNIEFKYANVELSHIAKDILKLLHENQNGAFIHLLKNTDSGTLCNNTDPNANKEKKCKDDIDKGTGVLNKLRHSFNKFKNWNSGENKQITIVIMSLDQKALIYRIIKKGDLDKNIDTIFFNGGCDDILKIKGSEWNIVKLNRL